MNAQTHVFAQSEELPWSRITAEVNTWRGACLQSFARAEASVTEALLFLSATGDRGRAVHLRHLVGQRLEDLASALGPGGAFADEGGAAFNALEAFRLHEGLRVHLAHDVAKIAIERNGNWIVVFRRLSIRSRTMVRETRSLDQAELAPLLTELRSKTQKLDMALTNLRRKIAPECAGSSPQAGSPSAISNSVGHSLPVT